MKIPIEANPQITPAPTVTGIHIKRDTSRVDREFAAYIEAPGTWSGMVYVTVPVEESEITSALASADPGDVVVFQRFIEIPASAIPTSEPAPTEIHLSYHDIPGNIDPMDPIIDHPHAKRDAADSNRVFEASINAPGTWSGVAYVTLPVDESEFATAKAGDVVTLMSAFEIPTSLIPTATPVPSVLHLDYKQLEKVESTTAPEPESELQPERRDVTLDDGKGGSFSFDLELLEKGELQVLDTRSEDSAVNEHPSDAPAVDEHPVLTEDPELVGGELVVNDPWLKRSEKNRTKVEFEMNATDVKLVAFSLPTENGTGVGNGTTDSDVPLGNFTFPSLLGLKKHPLNHPVLGSDGTHPAPLNGTKGLGALLFGMFKKPGNVTGSSTASKVPVARRGAENETDKAIPYGGDYADFHSEKAMRGKILFEMFKQDMEFYEKHPDWPMVKRGVAEDEAVFRVEIEKAKKAAAEGEKQFPLSLAPLPVSAALLCLGLGLMITLTVLMRFWSPYMPRRSARRARHPALVGSGASHSRDNEDREFMAAVAADGHAEGKWSLARLFERRGAVEDVEVGFEVERPERVVFAGGIGATERVKELKREFKA